MRLTLAIIITLSVTYSIMYVIHSTDIVIIINPIIKLEVVDDDEKKASQIHFYECL